jgi:hypothetical protein
MATQKKDPIAKVKLALDKLDATTAQAAELLSPVAKALKKELDAVDIATLAPGVAADLMYTLREASSTPANALASFKDVFDPIDKLLTEHFINTLAAGESTGVQGVLSRVQVNTSVVPVVNDWATFYEFIRKNKAFDLLNRAPNTKSIRERWDDKKQVPGVGTFVSKKVSVTKLKGK